MRESEIYNIEYTDHKEKISSRIIIPSTVPSANVKAIDVSDLTEDERMEICQHMAEYRDYVETQRKNMYSFEDFISLTKGKTISPKWRSFNTERIKVK